MSNIYSYSMESSNALTKLHPNTLAIALLAEIIMAFSTLDLHFSLPLVAALLLMVVAFRLPFKQIAGVLLLVSPMVVFLTLIQGFAQPGTPLFSFRFGFIHGVFSREGGLLGLQVATRVVLLALGMIMFFISVHPVKLARALTESGMPFRYAYTTVIALRFLPLIIAELQTIKNAQKARGYDIDQFNFVIRFLKIVPLMTPLLITSLRRASTIALAMDLRAFGADPRRTWVTELPPPNAIDKAVRFSSLLMAAGFFAAANIL